MKLLIAADIFPPESGGPATYCVTLADELVKRGDEVEIVSLNSESDASRVTCNLYHVTYKNKLLKYLQYFWLLFRHAKSVNVIYAMGPVNSGLPVLIVSLLRRKKFVVKVVGDYAWEQYQISNIKYQISKFVNVDEFHALKVGCKIGQLKMVERFVVRKANRVIVPSEYLEKIVVGWGVKPEKIEVIYNVVDFKVIEPIKHEGEKWLVSVGRLVPWKGMSTLIEIMPDLLKQFPDLKLKIVGGGPEIGNLRLKIEDLRLGDVVELVGELSHDKTLIYTASADVFILNSAYEGFSHVLVEAHNQGVPVLASNAGGNSEIVSGDALFKYNNRKEIIEKVLRFSLTGKKESKPHRFLGDMINETKKLLEQVCAS